MKEENSMYKPKNEELIKALEKACVFIVGEKKVCPAGLSCQCYDPIVNFRCCPDNGIGACEIEDKETYDVPNEKTEIAVDCWMKHFIRLALEIDMKPMEANDE
jgi:hypothetical protein